MTRSTKKQYKRWLWIFFLAIFFFGLVQILFELKPEKISTELRKAYPEFSPQALEYIRRLPETALLIPSGKSKDQVVKHFAYTLSYNEKYEQPDWVAYTLKASYLRGTEKRVDDFREDPAVLSRSAAPEDYRRSGYDRGHLVPAADMKWSKKAMSESFLLSNISPQNHAFNGGVWESLERAVRGWARRDSMLYIVSGPVLKGKLPTIGKNKVAVPKLFYKVVLDAVEPDIKAIGFVIPNKGAELDMWHFAVPVDSVERLTGINFFPALPDEVENVVERRLETTRWKAGR